MRGTQGRETGEGDTGARDTGEGGNREERHR